MADKKTSVRIGRLVVETGRDADGREVARAIEAELRRLAGGSDGRAPARGGGRVEAGSRAIELPGGTPMRDIGGSVARKIWQVARKEES